MRCCGAEAVEQFQGYSVDAHWSGKFSQTVHLIETCWSNLNSVHQALLLQCRRYILHGSREVPDRIF